MNKYFKCKDLTKAQIIEGAKQLAEITHGRFDEYLERHVEFDDNINHDDVIYNDGGIIDMYLIEAVDDSDIELTVKVVPIYDDVTVNGTSPELISRGFKVELSE